MLPVLRARVSAVGRRLSVQGITGKPRQRHAMFWNDSSMRQRTADRSTHSRANALRNRFIFQTHGVTENGLGVFSVRSRAHYRLSAREIQINAQLAPVTLCQAQ